MGVELDQDEAWEFLANAHTAIITVNRDDGWPMALPAWLVVDDRKIYVRKAANSATVRRTRKDPKVCVTVESGRAWADLKAVVLLGRAEIVEDVETLAARRPLSARNTGNSGGTPTLQKRSRPITTGGTWSSASPRLIHWSHGTTTGSDRDDVDIAVNPR